MSTSISDLTNYGPWFTQMPADASSSESNSDSDTGGAAIAVTGMLAGGSSALLNHLTDVMQSILAQYQETAGTQPSDSTARADRSAAAGMPDDEMLTELMADVHSELSSLESGTTLASADTTTPSSTARLAQALSSMAMQMLQSYGDGTAPAGASVSMTS